jgi:hypothetical protein
MVRMTTIHFPDTKDKRSGKVTRSCSHHMPECKESHYYAVPAIETRGTWRLPDMLSNSSIENLLTAYQRAGGTFRE